MTLSECLKSEKFFVACIVAIFLGIVAAIVIPSCQRIHAQETAPIVRGEITHNYGDGWSAYRSIVRLPDGRIRTLLGQWGSVGDAVWVKVPEGSTRCYIASERYE